jgi:hypothetical protein
MKSTGNFHHEVREACFGIAKDILNNATTLDASNGILNQYSRTCNDSVQPFVSHTQFFAF